MRFITFDFDGQTRPGILRMDDVFDLSPSFDSLLAIIDGGAAALASARRLADEADPIAKLDKIRLQAPIPQPRRSVFATGWNYHDHFEEGRDKRDDERDEIPDYPTFFTKASTTVIGPTDPVPHDAALSDRIDYEAEIAVVIGRGGRSIPAEAALDHVFGYTLANDVTARDIQRRHGNQWDKGKSIDASCPLGPVIVTADEIGDPQALELRCWVNGEIRQQASTAAMAFPIASIIEHLSSGMTLVPGDILLTGTPAGVGYVMEPPRFLEPGDTVEVSSPQIGELRNPVEARSLTTYEPWDATRGGAGSVR